MSLNKIRLLVLSLLGSIVLILLDQYTKSFAVNRLKDTGAGGQDIVISDGVLRLHYLENRGAAFSILIDQQWFFIILTVAVCLGIIIYYCRIPLESKFAPLMMCLVFLFSGAIGNLIDRISRRYVVDFIYFELIDFPVFNVADIYVTCSVVLLFILVVFKYKDEDLAPIMGFKTKAKDSSDQQ